MASGAAAIGVEGSGSASSKHHDTGVCEKSTPPEKNNRHWIVSFQSTKSGAGEQFLLLDCRARACAKGALLRRHRYHRYQTSIPNKAVISDAHSETGYMRIVSCLTTFSLSTPTNEPNPNKLFRYRCP